MSSCFCKRNLIIVIYGLMLSLSIGIPVIWFGRGTGCSPETGAFDLVMFVAGAFMALFSVAGLLLSLTAVPANPSGFCVNMLIAFTFILIGFSGTVFAFVVAAKGSGTELPGKGYKEYKLGSYSKWIQSQVKDPLYWNDTKTCMIQTNICTSFNNKYLNDTVEKFHQEPLTSLQSGCFKPSNDCGFTYRSPANWSEEKAVYNNPDCKVWDNDPKVLCFNCQSCRAGVADRMKHQLLKAATVTLGLLIGFVILSMFACCYTPLKNPGDNNGLIID